MNDEQIRCYGRSSCAGGKINNIGDGNSGVTTCGGSRSCQSVSYLKGTVKYPGDMSGYLSGAWTQLTTGLIRCMGEASCYKINNSTHNQIGCYGFRSCMGLEGTNNGNVWAAGVLSLENSILHNPSNVYLQGFYSGYNGTIY